MKKQNDVDDSLEFCKEIKYYEDKEHPLAFGKDNYPRLKEYMDWNEGDEADADIKLKAQEASGLRASLVAMKMRRELSDPSIVSEELRMEEELHHDANETERKKPAKKLLLRNLLQVVGCILIAFLLVYSVTTYVATYTRVHGESMEDTLHDGDVVLINRLAYRIGSPKQFDAIVFRHESNVNLVKRIIALPGQTIQIVDGTIYIDGEVVNENYGKEEIQYAGEAASPITLGEDEYFVMGDNRNNSTDSRSTYVGLVKRKDIIGRVSFRLYPLSQIGTIR